MKQRDFKKCSLCKEGVMKNGGITFYKITMERFIVDLGAIKRQAGLEMTMGSGQLAAAMGPDEDLANIIDEKSDVFVCEDCAIDAGCLAEVFESISIET